MQSTMMRLLLSLNHLLERAGTLFPESQIVSRLPDKSLRRHSYADFYARARALGAALRRLGLEKGDRVATLLWNHPAHLERYFGIPAAGGVMHTLNLRLAPSDIGWIAAHAEDRVLIVDDVPAPPYRPAEPPTLALGVPTLWLGMIQAYEAQPGRWRLPPNLRTLVGGAAVPESLIRAYARYGVRVDQGWGMTETSPVCTIAYQKPEFGDATEDERMRRNATAGVPVPLVDLRIVGEKGVAPWDGKQVGEIQVRGPFITARYHGVDDPS